jgi:hypothetical protein
MANQKASMTSGAEGFPRARSRRSVLSILPTALFALAMGGRSRDRSTVSEARPDNPAHAPRQRTHEYNCTRDVAMRTPLPPGSVRCYRYDAGCE